MGLLRTRANFRDEVLFHEPFNEDSYFGGIRHFIGLTYNKWERLLDLRVADPEERQNCAPTCGEIMEFIREHPNFTAHGYTVSPNRDDYRVSIEGVFCDPGFTTKDLIDTVNLFAGADEFDVSEEDGIYVWFD